MHFVQQVFVDRVFLQLWVGLDKRVGELGAPALNFVAVLDELGLPEPATFLVNEALDEILAVNLASQTIERTDQAVELKIEKLLLLALRRVVPEYHGRRNEVNRLDYQNNTLVHLDKLNFEIRFRKVSFF